MKPDEIKQVLADHALWLVDPTKGKQANLYRANLSWADLYEANLRGADIYEANLCGANLSEADLSGANLQEVRGLIFADCCWTGHGEKGRRLIGIKTEKGEITLYCGCFIGSKEELAWYISDGDEIHRESRTKAMEFVLSCLQ